MEKISKHVGYITKDKCFKKRLESVAKRRLSGPEKTFASMINTAGRKAYFAASRYDFFLLLIIRDDERYRWIREIENNSFSSMKQTIESLESGLRSMAIDEVFY